MGLFVLGVFSNLPQLPCLKQGFFVLLTIPDIYGILEVLFNHYIMKTTTKIKKLARKYENIVNEYISYKESLPV
jgi:hypothetical protein